MKSVYLKIYLVAIIACFPVFSSAVELSDYPKLQDIAESLVDENVYTRSELDALFKKATVQQSVLDAMTNPAEYRLTWGKYRKIFLKPDRIEQGVEFWNQFEQELARAEREYGVPASIIVSIIGVETKFGRIVGKHKVLDSLVTLVVGFPRRSAFFADELKHFLLLTKENGMPTSEIVGSYAGAVGYPQFIASSYRAYAVDFSGDGKTDLIGQPVDAIGSVANYFIKNGWKPGGAVTSNAHFGVNQAIEKLANRKRKTKYTAGDLKNKGAKIAPGISADEALNVLMLDASEIVPDPKNKQHYIVRAGDTACQIAQAHNIPCQTLFKLNKLNKRGDIFRGQRLKLPVSATSRSANASRSGKWNVSSDSVDHSKPRFFYTHHNFYAITKYNHSVLYAMAVHDLSVEIEKAKRKSDALSATAN